MASSEFLEAVRRRFGTRVPHNAALGLELLELREDMALSRLPFGEHLVGNPVDGVLHGGVITALMDATCGIAVRARLGTRIPIATLDLRIDYLKPAPARCDVFARVECHHLTREVAFVRASAFCVEDDPIASAHGCFVVGTRRGEQTGYPWSEVPGPDDPGGM